MNLNASRAMVANILDYSPEIEEYTNEVTDVLNEIYKDFFTDRAWTFAQKTLKLGIHADSTATDGVIVTNSELVGTVANFFEDWMEGQILEISGTTALDGEYEILSVVSVISAVLGDGYLGDALAETGVTFIVKQRYIDLPANCTKVLSLQIRDYTLVDNTNILHMPRARDEGWLLDVDKTGIPTDWMLADDITLDQPVLAPTLADGGAGANGVPVDGEYEVAYTFLYQNRESALSPSASIDMTAGDEINISGLPNTGTNSGIQKQIYFKHPSAKSWYKAESAIVAETVLISVVQINANFTVISDRAPEHEGYYNRVRLYPRQDEDYNLELRYLYQPTELVEDTDIPEFPPGSHRFLVYRACEELFVKHNNLSHSELYKKKAGAEEQKLMNRYLTEKPSIWVKNSFSTGPMSPRANNDYINFI